MPDAFPAAARLPLVDLDSGAGPDGWNPEHSVPRGPWTLGFPTDITQSGIGGCQNYGPFLGPDYNTAPNI